MIKALETVLRDCCSVAQVCLTLGDRMDCSTPGLSDPHHLPKFARVHVHCIGDAIQPSHPLMPSSPVFSLSQHEGLRSLSRVLLLETPWTAAYQAPPFMGFPRQEYWSGLPLPSPNPVKKLFQ